MRYYKMLYGISVKLICSYFSRRYLCTSLKYFCDNKPAPKPWHDIRLSQEVRPTHYHLWLFPNLRLGTFTGRVTISINVGVPQEHISVHIKGLSISSTRIMSAEEQAVELQDSFEHEPNEFWVVQPMNPIQRGLYKIHFEFSGKLTDKIVGLYRSVYRDSDGEERFIATSKFEPTFARQAFPCFDEPGFKAPFDIELVKPSGNEYIALSNMHQVEEIGNAPRTGFATVKFGTTKPMSTYLACFIICDFEYTDGNLTAGGFPVNLFARRSQIGNVHFAKTVAITAANFYLDYFNIPYPLPKLDLIAIPDFVSGAMENWGLITFRETRLLCDLANSSVDTQLAVALTVAHEIAHMWFGDLVTMQWWNDLWLNEGFATFVEYKAVAAIYPTWDIDGLFVLRELYPVLKADAALSSHPIILTVTNPDQITEIFDSISYNKGASVLRMLENTIGADAFKSGIHNYLNEYQLRNAETDDLWEHLNQTANNVDVASFMNTWTKQMGFPVIKVTIDAEKKNITFTQRRFLLDAEVKYDKATSPYGYMWEVPVTYVTSVNPRMVETAWIRRTEENVTVPLSEENSKLKWLKVNFHHFGYYIVNYELSMWNELRVILRNSSRLLHAIDRASLIYDAFSLAEAELLPYDVALNMTDYLDAEIHYIPWAVAAKEFHALKRRLYGTDAHDLFKKYVRFLIDDMRVITWDVDDRANYLQKSFKTTILNLGCAVGNTTCLNQALTLFKQWLSAPAMKLHPELASIILNFGVEQSNETEWNRLWELYLNEQNPQDKQRMMNALCYTKDPAIIQRYLQSGKNESYVRSQDYLTLINKLSQNPTANPLVWDFIRNEWEYLVKRYTLNDRYLGGVIPEVSISFSTETRLMQMKEFFAKYPEAGAGKIARQRALERVESNIKWRSKHVSEVTDWLKRSVPTVNG